MNYIFNIIYNGKFFFGSQSQLNFNTVNDFFLYIYYKYTKKIYKFIFSSRTDLLVNSLNQVVNFFNLNFLNKKFFLKFFNKKFLNYLYIFDIRQISNWFHSVYSSLYRIYCYIFNFNLKIFYIFINFNFNLSYKLNLYNFIVFLKHIVGYKNFFVFDGLKLFIIYRSLRLFYEFNFYKINNFIYFLFKSNSFLYNMIRNIISFVIFINYININSLFLLINFFYLKYLKFWLKSFDSNNLFLIKINYPF